MATIIIKADHQNLKYLLEQCLHSILQHKWLTKLHGADYEITYKKGAKTRKPMHFQGHMMKMLNLAKYINSPTMAKGYHI